MRAIAKKGGLPVGEGQIAGINLRTGKGLGPFGGLYRYLQDRSGPGRAALGQALGALLGKASQDKALVGVRLNTLADAQQFKLDVDRVQVQAMGLSVGDSYSEIQLMLAPVYVNDFG